MEQCPTCQRIKPKNNDKPGPTPIHANPHTTMGTHEYGFHNHLPEVDGYNAIVTFVDMFTKQAHFAPCSSNVNARQLAKIYLDTVYKPVSYTHLTLPTKA